RETTGRRETTGGRETTKRQETSERRETSSRRGTCGGPKKQPGKAPRHPKGARRSLTRADTAKPPNNEAAARRSPVEPLGRQGTSGAAGPQMTTTGPRTTATGPRTTPIPPPTTATARRTTPPAPESRKTDASVGVRMPHAAEQREHDDLEIQPERPVLDVVEVVLDALLEV